MPITQRTLFMRGIDEMENKRMAKYLDIEQYINNLRELRVGNKDTAYEYYDDGIDVAISEAARFPAVDIPRWIPVTERLPEEDKEVLITYRYKEGEGDTSHSDIDITSYGQMYFGGQKVGRVKHWRAPFEYFESNYEVIAWMPLPEPYKEEREA